ncbi:MAG TPA: addiction module protein [Ideonella sp.]|nr:addiction module protein [Ideonella sp.]
MDATALDKLRKQAQALDAPERAQLALDLLRSLDAATASPDVDTAWNDEAARRLARFDQGGVVAQLADDVHARAAARTR